MTWAYEMPALNETKPALNEMLPKTKQKALSPRTSQPQNFILEYPTQAAEQVRRSYFPSHERRVFKNATSKANCIWADTDHAEAHRDCNPGRQCT